MLNLIQHLKESSTYKTLKRVQDDKSGLFTNSSYLSFLKISYFLLSDEVQLLKNMTFCLG